MGSQRVSQRTRLKRLSTYAACSRGVQGTCLPCGSTCCHSVGAGVGCPASRARSSVRSFWLCPRSGISCQLTEFISPVSLPAVWLGSTAGCRIPSHPPLLQRRSGPFILFSEARFRLRGAGEGGTYPFRGASFPPPAATWTETLLGEVSHHPRSQLFSHPFVPRLARKPPRLSHLHQRALPAPRWPAGRSRSRPISPGGKTWSTPAPGDGKRGQSGLSAPFVRGLSVRRLEGGGRERPARACARPPSPSRPRPAAAGKREEGRTRWEVGAALGPKHLCLWGLVLGSNSHFSVSRLHC